MKNAIVSFKDKIAFSEDFGDIYFNTDKPELESEYVFCSAIDEIWHEQDSFIVAEAGFGTGLNFLSLCKRFKKSDKKLHFVSIEAYPIKVDDLTKIYSNLGIFKKLSKRLIKKYPPLINGIHRIKFKKNIILDLCFGDIKDMIKELDFKADIWFLDGFAPSKNSAMWSDEIFKGIAYLSKKNCIIRSYSSARIVRENLINNGFEVEIKKGYGKKREMTHAMLKTELFNTNNLWFKREHNKNIKNVLIIGGGISGILTALELKNLGFDVKIAEKMKNVATNGSSNFAGILMPLITKPGVNLGKMHLNAFLQAVRFYKKVLKKEAKFSSCFDYAYDENLLNRYKSWDKNEIFDFVDKASPYPFAFIKDAATLRPKKICQKFAKKLDILFSYKFKSYQRLEDGKILVNFKGGKEIKTDALVFTSGSHSVEIFKNLPISSVRGQVTHIKKALKMKSPISALGYITPSFKRTQVVGATYGRNVKNDKIEKSENNENLEKISEFIGKKTVKIKGGNVAYRSYSSDRFPIISALHDDEFYQNAYKNLFWIKHKGADIKPKYEKNVFLNIAHGSRGLGTAVLGANLIADLIANRPLCIEKSLFNELHSARFLIRKLKKGI